ncbi:MAG: tyrosine-protein phosphatase [Lachnospiraceae bacterium]|nr:tyrosine-protein phosphatase [Candidatus Equihabitans merdae]
MIISKQIANEKIPNLRDLGGMEGVDGRKIREGLLIRSEQLFNASENDKKLLEELPIRKILDFRNPKETKEKPDPVPANCDYLNLSIIDEASLISWEKDKTPEKMPEAKSAADEEADSLHKMREIYRDFIRIPYSRTQYNRFLNEVLSTENGAALWHCTLGKDRCGWGSVLVQAVLGVSKEAILEDYLYTNVCLKDEIAAMMAMFEELNKRTNMKSFHPVLFQAREEYLMAAYNEIDKLYGSMEAYIEEGLGIDKATIKRFRDKYLV